MKFWDSSAIVPLCVKEPSSDTVRSLLADDRSLVIWWATRVECVSTFMRQVRAGALSAVGERQARQVLATLARSWIEIQPTEILRRTAERLLAVHPLRAADAFQLAAALEWRRRQTAETPFISFDARESKYICSPCLSDEERKKVIQARKTSGKMVRGS